MAGRKCFLERKGIVITRLIVVFTDRIGNKLSICMRGMSSIQWKWSEWIPLAEFRARVAHTVATETAQHCRATNWAKQASPWHSLEGTQERYTEGGEPQRDNGNTTQTSFWTYIFTELHPSVQIWTWILNYWDKQESKPWIFFTL